MIKFKFRLQKVLEFREAEEDAAKNTYLDARGARLNCEAMIAAIGVRRLQVLRSPALTVQDRLSLENCLHRLNDDERAQQAVLSVLGNEEQKALEAWHLKKRELETMIKLKEQAFQEWELEMRRSEQAALDEWAVLRSAA